MRITNSSWGSIIFIYNLNFRIWGVKTPKCSSRLKKELRERDLKEVSQHIKRKTLKVSYSDGIKA